jgi:hypothetical protein
MCDVVFLSSKPKLPDGCAKKLQTIVSRTTTTKEQGSQLNWY